ncbi:hypothetical protein DDZ13_04350 [Coraliomargarita sinensis]|uniref:Uncharacterized protein n=1 Tax=Coraliomargarita sinensis TaxID=2174842 RepID=A0A317ZMM1_9BACT|nr:AsmA-like C-terminal region-containing protein [Coraliomargarita sinensis]PXA05198.1 hypothetical protein DDZ13_04350 [Coraliomargarita sinensis]
MSSRGKSRAATILELFLDGILLLCFIAQAFVLGCLWAYGHLPLPTEWFSQRITQQLPDGVSIRADSYALTHDGSIQLENVRLNLDGIQQAVFEADYAHAEFGVAFGEDHYFQLKEFVLSDGQLLLPAVYSPSGKNSTILEQIALRLIPVDGAITVDSFAARHEDIRLRGSIHWSLPDRSTKPFKVRQKADQFYKLAARVLREKTRFEGLTQPTIFFQVNSSGDQSLNVFSRVSSRAYQGKRLEAKNLALDATLSLTDQTLATKSSILLEADSIEAPDYKVKASYLSAKVKREEWEALLKGEWPDMEVVAERLDFEDISLESPRIKLSPQTFPEIAFSGLTSGLRGAVKFSGSANPQTRTANIQAAGSLDILSAIPEKYTEHLPAIAINQAPYYNLNLKFDQGFVLRNAELRARMDALKIEDLSFDHVRFRSRFRDGKYTLDKLYLRRDWQWLDLGFQLDSSSNDYALTLKGFAKPYDYNPILPRWWGSIFEEFDFEQVESGLGDFVIYGNTGGEAADFYFGHAAARNIGYKGVRVDKGELFVRGRGPYAEVYRLNARSGEGFARGNIQFASRLDEVRGPMSVRLDLDTKLPLSEAKKLFNENIASILSDFETDALPRTILKGAIFNKAYPEFAGRSYIDITASCPFPVAYKGIPLDYLNFDLIGREKMTYLRDIRLGYAGGEARADADIMTSGEGPAQTRFQLALKGAKQHQAISQLTTLRQKEKKQTQDDNTEDGQLDFSLHAQGPVEDPLKMQGFGSMQIENDTLYAIQLFGPLSRLLQNTRLGFTSFALNEMEASFALNQGTVRFQQLEINGPRTRIEAPGMMQLDDFSLAMRVSVYLFGNAGNPDSRIRRFGDLITKPIPNLLEFELTGTPEQQNWRSLYDPRKFIPQF